MPIVSIEGVNGSGKTTLLERLIPLLPTSTTIIRSPGGTPTGEKIRKTVKAALAGETEVSPGELAKMNTEGFACSMSEIIEPALKKNPDQFVLLDRWYDSTYAYQGAQGVPFLYIDKLLEEINCTKPHLTILLDTSVETAQKRHTPDVQMTQAETDFKDKIRRIFLIRASNNPNAVVIDSSLNPDIVFGQVIRALRKYDISLEDTDVTNN